MLGSCVNVKFLCLCSAKLVVGKHSLYGLLDHQLGLCLKELSCRNGSESSGISGMSVVSLLLQLSACELDLVSVYNYYIITGIDVGREVRMAAASAASLPRVWPSASMTYHFFSIISGLAVNVVLVNIFFSKLNLFLRSHPVPGASQNE